MTAHPLQDLIDELRGELDRTHHQDPGWSGPATPAYMRGYGRHPRQAGFDEQSTYIETHLNHGWHT